MFLIGDSLVNNQIIQIIDDLNAKNKLSDSFVALTEKVLETPKVYAVIIPWCIVNNPNNDVWDPSNATSITHDNTIVFYQGTPYNTRALKTLNGGTGIMSITFDVSSLYKWNQLRSYRWIGGIRNLQTIATTVNSNTACPAMTLNQFDSTFANPPSNYVAQQRWSTSPYYSILLDNLATNSRLCAYYKIRGWDSINLERLEYNCTTTDLQLDIIGPTTADINWISGKPRLKEKFTISNLAWITNNQPLTLQLSGTNAWRDKPTNSNIYPVTRESSNATACPTNGSMNNLWTISFGSNFTIDSGESCTYSILLPYTDPPNTNQGGNVRIVWRTLVTGDINEPLDIRDNNVAEEKSFIDANPITTISKKIFRDTACTVSADSPYLFESGNSLCYEIEFKHKSESPESPWKYPKSWESFILFDQLPANMPPLACKYSTGASWFDCGVWAWVIRMQGAINSTISVANSIIPGQKIKIRLFTGSLTPDFINIAWTRTLILSQIGLVLLIHFLVTEIIVLLWMDM